MTNTDPRTSVCSLDVVFSKLPKFHTSHEQTGRPHSGKMILFSAGLSMDFQHQRIVFAEGWGGGSVLELVRDERHLCPGRAEVNTLPRSRLELEQASV